MRISLEETKCTYHLNPVQICTVVNKGTFFIFILLVLVVAPPQAIDQFMGISMEELQPTLYAPPPLLCRKCVGKETLHKEQMNLYISNQTIPVVIL